MDKNCSLADPCCMILSNMTRPTSLVNRIIALIEQTGFSWDSIVTAFTAVKYNNVGASLHYLGPVFSNLSQSVNVRRFVHAKNSRICAIILFPLVLAYRIIVVSYQNKIYKFFLLFNSNLEICKLNWQIKLIIIFIFRYLMGKDPCVIQRLLPFTEYTESIVRRGGIVGTLKNCCFDTDNHTWLLSPEIDILPHLLLPLAGPEEFDDEDNNKLPLDLQFLPETKQRESDPDIRIMLLEALGQLCATKKGREILREKNTYVILRELHKWEKDKNVLLACENVVDILIR